MKNWVFALVALGVGVFIALYLDRMRMWPGQRKPREPMSEGLRERNKWLTFWFFGRFPTEDEDEEARRREDEAERKRRKDGKGGR